MEKKLIRFSGGVNCDCEFFYSLLLASKAEDDDFGRRTSGNFMSFNCNVPRAEIGLDIVKQAAAAEWILISFSGGFCVMFGWHVSV